MSFQNNDGASPCLALQGLKVSFGTQRVLDGLDWSLPAGRVVGLLGRNGAGKTTLIETLLGLRAPEGGTARLFGQPSQALPDDVRARIGYVPQRSDLFEWLTADQLLAYFRSFYPRWNTAKVDGLMSRWGIARDKPIRKLSGGEQQRLSIIRALAHEPELLVLDEPVASLDPAARRDFLGELVDQVIDRRTTIVFSTHILSDLERVAVDVAFLSGGRIALHAPLDELLESSVRLGGVPADIERFVREHRLQALSREAAGPVIARGRDAEAIPPATPTVSVDPATLEDLFLALTA
ncbi:ABC transporter ATP-binding protein [Scleromatobacter humisilvae]|uniref:ABC transporter ATP-binding protein n=1 Tax=Scleromatobacter humisilvae TaxID=2897159 RepID=A0A9X1YN53_9BURK|nr:ABC transporter ATP-binding protein [Scleromatobacter humisilvae]MCK9689258.1 ABC transporter ATP-binding protein [Scleromatobacter humisilvae]